MGKPVIMYEAGQTAYPFEAMVNSGDNTTYTASFAPISGAAGFEANVLPYGVKTGGLATPGDSANEVDVSAMTLAAPGMAGADANGEVIVAGATVTITRGSGAGFVVNSITVDDTGSFAIVVGDESTQFSETRGAAGGPPFIPEGSIEIAQTRTSGTASAVLSANEIYRVPNLHREEAGYPAYTLDQGEGVVTFATSLPLIHTGGVPKKVYIQGYTPLFAPIPRCSDWSPAGSSISPQTVDTYDGTFSAGSTTTLNSASFTAILDNGVSDPIIQLVGQVLWFEYRPDRDQTAPKQLTIGRLATNWTQQASGGKVQANFTIAPESESQNILA